MNKIRKILITEKTGSCPKEIGLDAMHVRSHKKHLNKNSVVLVAADTKKSEIMDYMWCDAENIQNYKIFVNKLEKNFKLNPRDLQNIVSDGHKAIINATEGLSQHRTICNFHILQNIAIYSSSMIRAKQIMREASFIFKEASFAGALHKFKELEKKWFKFEPRTIRNLHKSLIKTQDVWLSPHYSNTDNITERRIRDIRRKSRAMDNFRSKHTSEAVLEMILEQIKNFKQFGDWFSPIQKRIFI